MNWPPSPRGRIAPRHWITTNGLYGHLDSHNLTDSCFDFIAFDSYPKFGDLIPDDSEQPLRDRRFSWHLSITRSISPNFCIMEQQSGPGGWVNRIAHSSPAQGWLTLPEDVELAIRGGWAGRKDLAFLLNYAGTKQSVTFADSTVDLLSGQTLHGQVELEPYGVWIVEVPQNNNAMPL